MHINKNKFKYQIIIIKNIVVIFLNNYIKIIFRKKNNCTIFFSMRFTLIDHACSVQILLAAGLVPCSDTYTQCPNTYATCARATMPSTFRLPWRRTVKLGILPSSCVTSSSSFLFSESGAVKENPVYLSLERDILLSINSVDFREMSLWYNLGSTIEN